MTGTLKTLIIFIAWLAVCVVVIASLPISERPACSQQRGGVEQLFAPDCGRNDNG